MKVSRPFGLSSQYDVGVERATGILRVQVKSTIYKRPDQNSYSVNVIGAHREKYQSGTVDFFAILLIPIDD
ncbi:MAG: group I intron-associated PD-(D/E)XK endonuclease [Candidatus Sulfotelmatobacter sp.]